MSERGVPSFAQVVALCWRRPGLLARELAWRWIYGIPALTLVALACLRVYRMTSGALAAAGAGQISLGDPYQSAAIFAQVEQILRPEVKGIALWLLPQLLLGWAIASGIGRNIVFRRYEPKLPWRPVALSVVQLLRVAALAVTLALWWGSLRWSAILSSAAGMPNLPEYFVLVLIFTMAFLLLWSLSSWGLFLAPLFLLVNRQSLAESLRRSFWPGPLTGRLVGVNLAVSLIRFGLAGSTMILSLLPLPLVSSTSSIGLYLWLAAVSVLYLVASSFLQVVRLVAFFELWKAVPARQNPAVQSPLNT